MTACGCDSMTACRHIGRTGPGRFAAGGGASSEGVEPLGDPRGVQRYAIGPAELAEFVGWAHPVQLHPAADHDAVVVRAELLPADDWRFVDHAEEVEGTAAVGAGVNLRKLSLVVLAAPGSAPATGTWPTWACPSRSDCCMLICAGRRLPFYLSGRLAAALYCKSSEEARRPLSFCPIGSDLSCEHSIVRRRQLLGQAARQPARFATEGRFPALMHAEGCSGRRSRRGPAPARRRHICAS